MHTEATDTFCGTGATRDGGLSADRAKALVMAAISELVSRGHARWRTLQSGDVEVRLASGEVFLLGGQSVTRTA
jgi:hypothetical protein